MKEDTSHFVLQSCSKASAVVVGQHSLFTSDSVGALQSRVSVLPEWIAKSHVMAQCHVVVAWETVFQPGK